jgi:hypothetical protein
MTFRLCSCTLVTGLFLGCGCRPLKLLHGSTKYGPTMALKCLKTYNLFPLIESTTFTASHVRVAVCCESDLPFWINFVILSSLLIQFYKEKLVVPDLQIRINFPFSDIIRMKEVQLWKAIS